MYAPPTKRSAMGKARVARIFIACGGKCAICRLPIRDGEKYDIEHPDPLWAGGSDDDARLVVVHVRCHSGKTAAEAKQRARRNETIARGYVGNERPQSRWKKKLATKAHPFGETVERE